MRAFDVLSRADEELRVSAQPRFHLEMALLRWLHLRKLTPIADVIAALTTGPGLAATETRSPRHRNSASSQHRGSKRHHNHG